LEWLKLLNFPSTNKTYFCEKAMHIVLVSDDAQYEELRSSVPESVSIARLSENELDGSVTADAVFLLKEDAVISVQHMHFKAPIFINSVTKTLAELKLASTYNRINGWPGFIARQQWEVAASDVNTATDVITGLGKKAVVTTDTKGLVSARVVAMIINEAYYALGDGISTKEDIDTAMKLGTNYPFGPFEWAKRIGLHKIHQLLTELSVTDKRYSIAPALSSELNQSDF
jgi:3-hydroxybutyryl-CoA dehydrogenase